MTTAARNRSLGRYGEDVAARWLVDHGMVLIERNWRCAQGEIDLVLREGTTLVVCEVKTRTDERFGHPLEVVGPVKVDRLRRLALRWIEAHDVRVPDIRVDLVGVLRQPRGASTVEHVRGIG